MNNLKELHEKVLIAKEKQKEEQELQNKERGLSWKVFLEDITQLAQCVKDTIDVFAVPTPVKDNFGNTICLVPEESPIGDIDVYEEFSIKNWNDGQPEDIFIPSAGSLLDQVHCRVISHDCIRFDGYDRGKLVDPNFKKDITDAFFQLFDNWSFYKEKTEDLVRQIMEDFLLECGEER